MRERQLQRLIRGQATSDGAGVRLIRTLGRGPETRLDPFLMLDSFGTDRPEDYIQGFPAHPHRGFETVTYMLEGHMRHEDHLGNRGELRSGDVQWMTAGRGIVHSEMPQQERGRMHGFQLWINLPAAEKMKPASYRDIPARDIPTLVLPGGGEARVIAGALNTVDGEAAQGPISGLSTEPIYADIRLQPGESLTVLLPEAHNGFVYPYEGELRVGEALVPGQNAGVLSRGERLSVEAGEGAVRFLLLAGKPIGEPVAQYGPFVMNTREELEQALRDYRDGTLAKGS